MLNSLSGYIADFLLRQKCFKEELLPVYDYGIKVFLSSVLGVLLVIGASLFLGVFECGILFLLSFIGLRLFTGGLHCNSYAACNITTILTFVAVVLLRRLLLLVPFRAYVLCLMMVASILVVAILAPVSHPNKKIAQKDRMKFRLISIGIIIIHIVIVLSLRDLISTEVIIITDFISGIYIIVGLIKNKKERRKIYEVQADNS